MNYPLKNDNKKTLIAFFAGLSAFVAVFENFIPTPLPLFRFGFSNIVVLLGFPLFSYFEIFFIVIFKTVFSHLFRGTLFSFPFLIGISGSLLFALFTYPFYKIFSKFTSFIAPSVIGALFHNFGQIVISFIILPKDAVFIYGTLLISIGTIIGFINGIICNIIYNKIIIRYFMEDKFYIIKDDQAICNLCPNNCRLTIGKKGLCGVRTNKGMEVINPYSGIISGSSLDPVEKKPLYHFYPNEQIYSIGFYGCTLSCQFCQNFNISQELPPEFGKKYTPVDILNTLKKNKSKMIAFTYSEPTLYFEWVLETAKLCKENGIKTVLVTNGYLNKRPAEILLEYIDAVNVDLKSAKDEFYKTICKGKIEPVKEFIKTAYKKNVHIEITTLVITDTNDDIAECTEISRFIADISKDIPYHISRYHPAFKFSKPPTPEITIENWVNEAKKYLNFVYGGNVSFSGNTYCKKCQTVLVERENYNINIKNLGKYGICGKCNEKNYFIVD